MVWWLQTCGVVCMVCAWRVHGVCMACAWRVRGVHGVCVACAWRVCMACARCVRGLVAADLVEGRVAVLIVVVRAALEAA